MTRILSLAEVSVPELAAATGLKTKDIYRVVKDRRAGSDLALFKTRGSTANLKLQATEAVAVAASLRTAPNVPVDRAKMAGLFVDYLRSARANRYVNLDTHLFVDADDATTEVVKLLEAFNNRKDVVEVDPAICGGDPVFKGTSISVHNIARRLDLGDTADDILADLPSLSREHVLAAPQLAAAHPLRGRPRQTRRAPTATGLTLDELMVALKRRPIDNTSEN